MAWETYRDVAWNLQFNEWYSDSHEGRCGLLLWPGAYEYATNELLDHLPDETKAAQPADVLLAHTLATLVDEHGNTADMRLQLLSSLRRTINRLLRGVADAGNESFDCLTDENYAFLGHLARTDPSPDEDDADPDWDDDDYESSTNRHGVNYQRSD
ncbi:hypothetical protein A5675_21660 [Mycobacterium malmoense]|nr:hypothetical protein A5675_21660 [Mycobacterium malmoense]